MPPPSSGAAIGVHVLPEQRDLAHALRRERRGSPPSPARRAGSLPRRACRARRRSVQYLLQPSMIDTNAVGTRRRAARAGGRTSRSRGSSRPPPRGRRARSCSIIAGRRCSVCGPNTRSTNGARSVMPSPSWLATQPPTPMITPGRASLSRRQLPEQREHLLLRLLAHRAGVEQQQVRGGRVVRGLVPARLAQHVRHAGGVVLVHLAAVGLEVDAGHGDRGGTGALS